MRHLITALLSVVITFRMPTQELDATYLYYNKASPVQWGSYSLIKKYIEKHSKNLSEKKRNIKKLDELNREINLGTHSNVKIKKIGQFHFTMSPEKNSFFQADLMDVLGSANKKSRKAKTENDGFVWLLLVINIQTKKLYFRAQKSKTAKETSYSLADIFEKDIKARKESEINIQVDEGGEFINKQTIRLLDERGYHNINIYHSFSRHKAAIVERVIGTIRPRLTRAMETKGWKWIPLVRSVINNYNNSYHSSIQMTPNEAEKDFPRALFNLKMTHEKKIKAPFVPAFKKDDVVRVRVHYPHTPFKKGSHRKFSAEVFNISSVRHRIDHTLYKLANEKGQIMDGTYNDNDLIPAKFQDEYNVIILDERQKKNGKKEMLVQYDGFPDYEPQWIREEDLITL